MKKLQLVLTGLMCLTSLHSSLSWAAGGDGGASGNGNGKTVEMAKFKKIEGADMFHKALNLFDQIRGIPKLPKGITLLSGEFFTYDPGPDKDLSHPIAVRGTENIGFNLVDYGPLGQEVREDLFDPSLDEKSRVSYLTFEQFDILQDVNGTLATVRNGHRMEFREVDGLILLKLYPNKDNECYERHAAVDGVCEMLIFRK